MRTPSFAFAASFSAPLSIPSNPSLCHPRPPPLSLPPKRRHPVLATASAHPSQSATPSPPPRYIFDDRPWWRSVFTIRGRAFPFQPILSCVLSALLFCALSASPLVHGTLSISPLAHTILGGPLGFLLVFRMNQAFARWSAAHALLVQLCNSATDVATMSTAWLPLARSTPGIRLLQAFLRCVHGTLRHSKTLPLPGVAPPLRRRILSAPRGARPALIIAMVRREFSGEQVANPILSSLDGRIAGLLAIFSKLAMLQDLKTVKPLSYSLHIKSLLMIFLWTLPPVLLGITRFIGAGVVARSAVVVCMETVVAWAFTGVDAASQEAEAPMGSDRKDIDVEWYVEEGCEALDGILQEAQNAL